MKLYLICPTCGSDDGMKNGMTRRGKQCDGRRFRELAAKLCELTLCGRRTPSLDYSKSRGKRYGPNGWTLVLCRLQGESAVGLVSHGC